MSFEVADVYIQMEPRGKYRLWAAHKRIRITHKDRHYTYGVIIKTGVPVEKDHGRWVYRPWKNL